MNCKEWAIYINIYVRGLYMFIFCKSILCQNYQQCL